MPNVLIAAAVLIAIGGSMKLVGRRASHRVPWASLLLWVVLFAGTVIAWVTAARF